MIVVWNSDLFVNILAFVIYIYKKEFAANNINK